VLCLRCGRIWRTAARYAETAPDAPAGWEHVPLAHIREVLDLGLVPR
jgi:hypothetical protein